MTIRKQRVIQTAEKLVQRGRLEAAIGEYRKVLREVPNDTRTLNRVGDLYLRLKRVQEAVDLFQRAASHFSGEGFYVKAIAIYKKIIRVDPTRIAIYELLADLYRQQGLLNEARAQYQVVVDYHAQNDDATAVISIQEKIVELDPDDPSQRLKMADLYLQRDEPRKAMKQYREIAELMIGHERYEEATRVYLRAIELDPSDLDFLTDAVLALRDREQAAAAEQLMAKAVELHPEAERVRKRTGLGVVVPVEEAEGPTAPAAPPPELEEEPEEEVSVLELSEPSEPPRSAEAVALEPPEAVVAEAVEFEIELDEFELEVEEEAAAPAQAGAEAQSADAEPAPPEDLAAATAGVAAQTLKALSDETPEVTIEAAGLSEQALELMAEAQVLAAYGLDEKAAERFEQVLAVEPANAEAHRRLIELQVQEGPPARVLASWTRALEALPEKQGWGKLRELLEQEGYRLDGDRLEPPLVVAGGEIEAAAATPSKAAGTAPAAESAGEPALEESTITWLEQLGGAGADSGAGSEEIFGEEQEFFDLAAELEEELEAEELQLGARASAPTEEQSLEEIVEGFKQGVAETLSQEDYDTHYNLGIAYREMGLLDEAIGEFQLAAKDPRYLVDCCSLLGASFLEKGFGDLAVKWYRRGLDSPEISSDETLGLLYELGNLYLVLGDSEEARQTFVEIYGVNTNYRDVVAKLEDLRELE